MEKNTLKAIAVIALVIGAFGITFGYLATTQPQAINPILLLSQIPAPEGEQGGQKTSWCRHYEDVFIQIHH